jgi:DNA-binding transcriptional LysR family regulator
MAAAAEALQRTASGEAEAVRGAIRITAPDILGVEVVPPILAAFHERWPQTAIELSLTNRNEDLLRREADIAVRTARPGQGALLAKLVGQVRLGLYARRSYLASHGTPRSLADLSFAAIGFDRDDEVVRRMGETRLSRERFSFRSDNDLAQLAAVRAGFGIGACQAPIARRDPDLLPVLEGAFDHRLEIWVAMHEDLKASRRMRLIFDALVEGLAKYLTD